MKGRVLFSCPPLCPPNQRSLLIPRWGGATRVHRQWVASKARSSWQSPSQAHSGRQPSIRNPFLSQHGGEETPLQPAREGDAMTNLFQHPLSRPPSPSSAKVQALPSKPPCLLARGNGARKGCRQKERHLGRRSGRGGDGCPTAQTAEGDRGGEEGALAGRSRRMRSAS